MTIAESTTIAVEERPLNPIQWGPAIAGAFAAAALAFVMHSFAVAIGLSVSSTAPTWRDSSAALLALSGLYLIVVAVIAFGLGGYLAGRLRAPAAGSGDEIEFRDGSYGILVWAIALVMTAFISWAVAQSASRLVAPSGSSPGSAQSVAGENIIAFDLDRLFRAEKRPPNTDLTYARSEAARILLTAAGHAGVAAEDRTYLIRLTAATTGLAQPEAERRVDTVIGQARDNIRKARRAGIILAFMAGAAALVGAAVAWYAAIAGGEHRDGRTPIPAMWSSRPRRSLP